MGRLALTLQHAAATPRTKDDAAWEDARAVDEKALEPWVFEAICLQHEVEDGSTPHRVVVGIERELLGFVVRERAFWLRSHTARARKVFIRTEADAIVEAGRIAHDWLCRGYAVFSSDWEPPAT